MAENDEKEKLCLMLDSELDPSEALELLVRIEDSNELRMQWWRYCLISESLKSGRILIPDTDFVERVAAALANEPTVLIPRRHRFRIPERWVTGALAASVALVAVLVGLSLIDSHYLRRGSNLFASADSSGISVHVPVDPKFHEYLVTHYETAYLAGTPGMLPSVRLVSSDPIR